MAERDQLQDTTVTPRAVAEIVSLPAEIDIVNGVAVGQQLLSAFRRGVRVVVADMSRTEYCDSTGIRHLIMAHNHAVCAGAELRVVISSTAVRRVLHLVGADQMLRVYPDLASALTGAPQAGERLDA